MASPCQHSHDSPIAGHASDSMTGVAEDRDPYRSKLDKPCSKIRRVLQHGLLVNATTFSDQLAGVLDGWIAADNRQVSCEAIFKQKNTTVETRSSVPLNEEHFVAGAVQYLLPI